MKKILFIIICFLSFLLMSSCYDTRIRDIDGIIWKDEYFNIVATSEQLQNGYYSLIEVDNNTYSCRIHLANNDFFVELVDSTTDETIYFFGDSYDFLWGHYGKLVKEKDKEYKYSLEITLTDNGQYFEYCESNSLSFPRTITLYGFEWH